MANFRIYNDQLCPDMWNSAQHLNSEVRLNLLRAAQDFYEKTNLPSPIIEVYLMGSIANYNWTADSDADVHVIIDYKKLQMPIETAAKTVKTAGAQWNQEHNVFVKGHKVEMNLQDAAEPKPYVTGIYSLMRDMWIRRPFRMTPRIDKNIVQVQYKAMKAYIDNALRSGDREQMKAAKKYLDAYRQYGLDTYGELSYENIIFKILRARGIIKKLKNSITAVYDKQMSVSEGELSALLRRPPPDKNFIIIGIVFPNGEVTSGVTLGGQGHSHLKLTPNQNSQYNVLNPPVSWRYRSKDNTLYAPTGGKKEKAIIISHLKDKYKLTPSSEESGFSAYFNKAHRVDEVGERNVKQTLPGLSPEDGPEDDPEFGDPKFDRSYWTKFNPEVDDFELPRLTIDELKALREKARRLWSAYRERGKPEWSAFQEKEFAKYDAELRRRIRAINAPVTEGVGAGIPEDDRLKIKNMDGSTRRWQIRSKDAPKTPKMTQEEVIAIPDFDSPIKSKKITDDHDDVVNNLEPHDDTS